MYVRVRYEGLVELTFTSRDEKRCSIVTIAAAVGWYVQRSVVYVCRDEQRGTKNYDEQRCCHRRHAALQSDPTTTWRDIDLCAFRCNQMAVLDSLGQTNSSDETQESQLKQR